MWPVVAWFCGKLTKEAIKGTAETVNAVAEVPKTIIETEKARLEVAKLKKEQRESECLIVPASMDDVRRYDPKIKKIDRIVEWTPAPSKSGLTRDRLMNLLYIILVIGAAAGGIFKLVRVIIWR